MRYAAVSARAQTQAERVRLEPPILTVTAQGHLLLANRVVALANLEEHLRRELAWREQDTLFLRGDRVQRDFPEVTAIAKRAGARAVRISMRSRPFSAKASTGRSEPASNRRC